MAIVNGYVTLPEIRRWVSINNPTDTLDDTELEDAVNAASRWIDQHCQRTFWPTDPDTTRVLDACRGAVKLGAFNDLAEIVSVDTDDDADGVFETTWAATDYQALPLQPDAAPEPHPYTEIRAIGSRSFPRPSTRRGLVQITGTWGWAAIPAAVKKACLIQASRVERRKDSPEGVVGWGGDGVIRMSREDPTVTSLLAPYRHPDAVALVA